MSTRVEVLAVERWPDIPGHAGEAKTWRGIRRAVSEDGRWWLVRRRGIFRRWTWRPVRGMFVSLYETEEAGA